MNTIIDLAQTFGDVSEPVIAERPPRPTYTGITEALNAFVASRGIPVYNFVSVLPERDVTDLITGEVKTLPAVASYQVRKWFLKLNSNGSIYHSNNGKNSSIWYIKADDNSVEFVVKDAELLASII